MVTTAKTDTSKVKAIPGARPELGDVVRDRINGLTGVVSGMHVFLHGCVRCSVEPMELKEKGEVASGGLIDERQLEVLERARLEPHADVYQRLVRSPAPETKVPPAGNHVPARSSSSLR